MTHHITLSLFRAVWKALAANQYVDRIDSDEYNRIVQEWRDAGQPEWSLGEIVRRAAAKRTT